MVHGKSIRIFLTEGSANGLLTAEIVNWTGQVVSAPRSKLGSLLAREECQKTGIYFLLGENTEPPFYPHVYIGESDTVANRLKDHGKTAEQGGKDFWEKVCVVTSQDRNLTKAHIRYLEKRLIQMAAESGRCELHNANTGFNNTALPEADMAAMEYFLEQVQVLLPVLGFDFLKAPARRPIATASVEAQTPTTDNQFYIKNGAVDALMVENDGEFVVLAGSRISPTVSESAQKSGYNKTLRPYLFEHKHVDEQTHTFLHDYPFKSVSAAAEVILGRSANGRTEWKSCQNHASYAKTKAAELE